MQDDVGLIDGAILDEKRLFLIASSAKLEQEEVEHVFVLQLRDGQWTVSEEDLEAIRVVVTRSGDQNGLALMGMFGRAIVFQTGGGASRETIGDPDNGPSDIRPLNDMAQIGASLFVVGMRRQVYKRRLDQRVWTRIDDGVFIPISDEAEEGFLAVDGFTESEIYAAGFEGEIWWYDGSTWSKVQTPTNLRLEGVCCLSSGRVITVGEAGVILTGRRDQWSSIEQTDVESDLVSVAEFQDQVYVCSEEEGVFLLQDGRLIKCDTGVEEDVSFQRLRATPSQLLAVAESAALIFDGNRWQPLDLPDVPGL